MDARYVVGVDLGGTKILTVLADLSGKVQAEIKVPTGAAEGPDKVIARITATIEAVRQQAGVCPGGLLGVGVGAPGPDLDIENGIVHFSNNLSWYNVPLKAHLQEKLQVPVIIENDANAAAMGEYAFGAGKCADDMVYLTVSTGIGGGIIIGGAVYHGAAGSAGEFGHMTVMPNGPQCTCGKFGCLEALASGTAIAKAAAELLAGGGGRAILQAAGGRREAVDARAVAGAAAKGDAEAQAILAGAARALGIGIANIVNTLNPPLIVLGGGVMKIKEMIWPTLEEELSARALKYSLQSTYIVPAALGSKAGAMGAAAIALSRCR